MKLPPCQNNLFEANHFAQHCTLEIPQLMAPDFGFDTQAAAFDRRAGLPTAAARAVAVAILETVPGPGALLDIGAGTGEIGSELANALARSFASQGPGRCYLGLDLSLSMLGVFHYKLSAIPRPGVTLLRADAERPWPVRAGTVSNFLFSRSAHLLKPQHLVAEMLRAARPSGALLTVGRVRREKNSVRAQMRRRMRQALQERGVEGKAGEAARNLLVATLEAQGGQPLAPRRVASWPRRERPAESLDAWSKKPGLAGLSLPAALRRAVLSEVEAWAEERWGNLDTAYESTEHYELSVVCLPTAS